MKSIKVLIAAALLSFGLCASAQATTWNLAGDFSASTNPNGAWTYGYEQSFNSTIITYSNPAWNDPTNNYLGTPALWKNTGSTTAYGVAPGEVSLHPGSHGEFSIARWTSSITGYVDLTGYFGAGDIHPMSYYITKNSGLTLFSDPNDINTKSFSLSTLVGIGDTIDFMVGVGPHGDYYYGNTPVSANIAPVPEPGTMVLLGMGVFGVAVYGKRRKNKES